MNNNDKRFTFTSITSCTDPANSEADFEPAIGAILNDDHFIGGFFDINIDFRNGEVTITTDVDDALDRTEYVAHISELTINGDEAADMDPDELISALKTFAQPAEGVTRFKTSQIKDIAAGAGIKMSYNRESGIYTIHSNDHDRLKKLEVKAGTYKVKEVRPYTEYEESTNDPQSDPQWTAQYGDDDHTSGLFGHYDPVTEFLYIGVDRDNVGVNMEEVREDLNDTYPIFIHQGVQEGIADDEDTGIQGAVTLWSGAQDAEITSAKTVLSGGKIEFYETPEVALHIGSRLWSGALEFYAGTLQKGYYGAQSLSIYKKIDESTELEKTLDFGALTVKSILILGDLDESFVTASGKVALSLVQSTTALSGASVTDVVSATVISDMYDQMGAMNQLSFYGTTDEYDSIADIISRVPVADQSHEVIYLWRAATTDNFHQVIWKKASSTWQAADMIDIGNLVTSLTDYYTKTQTLGLNNLTNYYNKTALDTKFDTYKVKEIKAGTNTTIVESPTGTFTINAGMPTQIVDVVNVVTTGPLPAATGFDLGTKFCVLNVNVTTHAVQGNIRSGNGDSWIHFGDPYYESWLTRVWRFTWPTSEDIFSQRWSLLFPKNHDDAKAPWAWPIKNIWYTSPCTPLAMGKYDGAPIHNNITNTINFRFYYNGTYEFRDASGGPIPGHPMWFNQGYQEDGVTPKPNKYYTGGSAGIKLKAQRFKDVANIGWQWYDTTVRAMDSLIRVEPDGKELVQLNTFPANNNSWNDFKAIFDSEFSIVQTYFARCDEDALSGAWNKYAIVHKTMNSGWDDNYIIETEDSQGYTWYYRYTDYRGGGARWADAEQQDTYYFGNSSLAVDKFYWVVEGAVAGTKVWEEYQYSRAAGAVHPINLGQVVLGVPYDKQGLVYMTYRDTGAAFDFVVMSSEQTNNIKALEAGNNITVTEDPVGSGIWTIDASGGGGGGQVHTDATLTGDGLQATPLSVANPFTPSSYYTKTEVDALDTAMEAEITAVEGDITTINTAITGINTSIGTINTTLGTYKVKEVVAGTAISVTEGTGADVGKWTIDNTYTPVTNYTINGAGTTASPLAVASPFDSTLYYLAADSFKKYGSPTYGTENLGKSLCIIGNAVGLDRAALLLGGGSSGGYIMCCYPVNPTTGNQSGSNTMEWYISSGGYHNLKYNLGYNGDNNRLEISNTYGIYINGDSKNVRLGTNDTWSVTNVVTQHNHNTDDFYITNVEPKKFSINPTTWKVKDLVEGTGIDLDYDSTTGKYTINSTAVSGVSKIIAGTNVTISPSTGLGDVTINASSGGGGTWGTITGTINSQADLWGMLIAGTGITITPNTSTGKQSIACTIPAWAFTVSGNTMTMAAPGQTSVTYTPNVGVAGITAADSTITIGGTAANPTIAANIPSAGVSKIIAGSNITISPSGGTGEVTITASAGGSGGIEQVVHDSTLTGQGTSSSPLSVVFTGYETTTHAQATYETAANASAAYATFLTTANAASIYATIATLANYYTETETDAAITSGVSSAITTALTPINASITTINTTLGGLKVKEVVAGTNISVTEGTGANVGKWTIANTQAATTFTNIGGAYSDNTSLMGFVGTWSNVAGSTAPATITAALNDRYHNVAFTADANYKAIGFTTTKGSSTTTYTVSGNDFYMDLSATEKQTIKEYVDSRSAEIHVTQGWDSVMNIFTLTTQGKFRLVHKLPDDSKEFGSIYIDSAKSSTWSSFYVGETVSGIGTNQRTIHVGYYTVFYWNATTSKWTWLPAYATDKLYEDSNTKVWEDEDDGEIYIECKGLEFFSIYVYITQPFTEDEMWIEHYNSQSMTLSLEDSLEALYYSSMSGLDGVVYRGNNDYTYYGETSLLNFNWYRNGHAHEDAVCWDLQLQAPDLMSNVELNVKTPSDFTYTYTDSYSFWFLELDSDWKNASGEYQGNDIQRIFGINDKEMIFDSPSGALAFNSDSGYTWHAQKISAATGGGVITKMQFNPSDFDLTGDRIEIGESVWDSIENIEDSKANKCLISSPINEQNIEVAIYPDTAGNSQTNNGDSIYINFSLASIKGGYSGDTSTFTQFVSSLIMETAGWGYGQPFGPTMESYRIYKFYCGNTSPCLYLYLATANLGTSYTAELGIASITIGGSQDINLNHTESKPLIWWDWGTQVTAGFMPAFSNYSMNGGVSGSSKFIVSWYQRPGNTIQPFNPTTLGAQWIPVDAWTLEIKPGPDSVGVINTYCDYFAYTTWNPSDGEHTPIRKKINTMFIPLIDGTSNNSMKYGPSSIGGELMDLVDFSGSNPATIIGNFLPSDFTIDSTTGKIKLKPGHSLSEDSIRTIIKEELIKLFNDKEFKKSLK